MRQALTQQITAQNSEMKQALADQKDEIKHALVEQKTELKEEIQQLRTNQKALEERIEQRVDEKIQRLEQKMSNMEEHRPSPKVDEEIQQLKKKILEIEKNGTTTTGWASSIKLKPPSFDGTSPFEIFQLQFETATTSNHWSEADKVAALIVALKRGAVEIPLDGSVKRQRRL